ncbi:unnamed protein product [Pseudo-nitzschia multistriata]|uniref:Uncharacterized protein n=1 Tax=Pseudo-nitzschia multistriata TaxID=183589 RepID=A0A448YVN3_9STRA|nr:unnamed protein product [Pseudo-nitzschia multistriata]
MVQSRMNGSRQQSERALTNLGFDLVQGHGRVLALGPEGLDDHRLSVKDGRVDPRIPPVRQVFHIVQLAPLQVQAGPGDRRAVGALVALAQGRLLFPARASRGLGELVVAGAGRHDSGSTVLVGADTLGSIEQSVRVEGVDRGHRGAQRHVDEEFHRGRLEDDPSEGEIDDGDIGVGHLVADGDGYCRSHVAKTRFESLGSVRRVARHPHDIVCVLGPLAQGRGQLVRAFVGPFSVIHVYYFLANGVFEGRGPQVRIRQLVGFWAGSEPHLSNVKPHDLTRTRQYCLHMGRGIVKELVVIKRSPRIDHSDGLSNRSLCRGRSSLGRGYPGVAVLDPLAVIRWSYHRSVGY